MATRQNKIAFQIGRFGAFLKLLVSRKKSAFGLGLIILFVVLALGSPLFTPYTALGEDPSMLFYPLSASSVAPVWLRNFPTWLGGNPGLSENMFAVNEAGLPKLAKDGGEWSFSVNRGGISDPVVRLDVGVPSTYVTPAFRRQTADGSLAITFTRASGTSFQNGSSIVLYKEFDYPFLGPPGRFVGNIDLLVRGSNYTVRENPEFGPPIPTDVKYLDVPVVIRVFLGEVGGKEWKIWPTPNILARVWPPFGFALDENKQPWGINKPESGVLIPGGWVTSMTGGQGSAGQQIDSESNSLVNALTDFGEQSAPHRMVFTERGTYVYGVEITFLDQRDSNKSVETTVFIDDLALVLHGTSFGLMGTDHHGRDLFAQLIYGTRISLYIGVSVALLSVVIGLAVGLAAGYLGRYVDEGLMRFSDLLLVLPGLPLLVVLVAVLGTAIENLIVLLGLLGWMGFARMVRSQVLSIKERPFVEAAKAVGAGRFHIIINHVLPSVMSLVYISLATAVPGAVTAEAALSWLGFYDPQRMSWGRMLNGVFEAGATTNWWWVIPPGLCISLLAAAFILLGYALDEVLNPKLRLRK